MHIFQKTASELLSEISSKKGGNYIPSYTSPYYVCKKDGTRIDVTDLPEDTVLSLVEQSLIKGTEDFKNKNFDKKGKITAVAEAENLVKALDGHFNSSWEGTKKVLSIIENKNISSGWAEDLLSGLYKEKLEKMKSVSKYSEELKGNFGKISYSSKLDAIDQLNKIDIAKQRQLKERDNGR